MARKARKTVKTHPRAPRTEQMAGKRKAAGAKTAGQRRPVRSEGTDRQASVSTMETRRNLADLLNRVLYRSERVVISRRDKDLAALVPLEDLEFLEELEDRMDVEAARKALRERGSIPWEKVKTDLGL